MRRIIIDRFEGEFAVCECEGKHMENVPRGLLPAEAKEGDCLVEKDGAWQIDVDETSSRKSRIDALAKSLFVD